MASAITPIRGGSHRAVLRRARTLLELEAAVEREAARLLELAREFGASDDDIAAALDDRAHGPTEQLERQLCAMDSRVRAAEKASERARADLKRATAVLSTHVQSQEEKRALILELLAAGLGVREVARRVGLSPATIVHYRNRWADRLS